jgi:long-chain acyl-CoA synthetase
VTQADLLAPHLQRIIGDLLVAELRQLHPQRLRHLKVTDIDIDADIRQQFDLDSLDLMRCAMSVATLFNIYDSGYEDALLAQRTVSAWRDLVARLRQEDTQDLTFATSGSMGKAKNFRHDFDWLLQEANAWAKKLKHVERIVVCVPSHHIFGAIWTCLLPQVLQVPVLVVSTETISLKIFNDHDLLVTVPPVWEYLASTMRANKAFVQKRVCGISSTAVLSRETHENLIHQAGFAAIWQIYGSTETAGLAHAENANSIYTWLLYLQPISSNTVQRTTPQGTQVIQDLPDDIVWLPSDDSHQTFELGVRNDDIVKIGGHRVSLQKIEQTIAAHQQVSACLVRFDEAQQQLKALIVPATEVKSTEDLLTDVQAYLDKKLPAYEVPRHWDSCLELPTNSLGKRVAW